MKLYERIGLLLSAGFALTTTHGVCRQAADSLDWVIYYRFDNYIVHLDYMTNNATFEALDTLFKQNPLPLRWAKASFVVEGFTSPGGADAYNQRLSQRRAVMLRSYLRQRYPVLRANRITSRGLGAGDRVRIPASEQHSDTARARYLRYATIRVVCEANRASVVRGETPALQTDLPDADPVPACDPEPQSQLQPESSPVDSSPEVEPVRAACSRSIDSSPRFALKTNLLYWAALTPNIELEYYFARRWSLNLEYQGAWWSNRDDHKFFRLIAGSPELRYWIGHREHFRGHFVGAYAGVGSYEFMGRPSSGLQGEFYIMGGISYGYAFRVGSRLRMEASIGLGYMVTDYREYHWNSGCYVYDRTKRQTWMGPTKVKLSLTYPFGKYAHRKRGER